MYDILNKKSGLLGVSGISNDTRDIEEAALKGDKRALLSAKLFARRVADFIGSYFVRMGRIDLMIFSAGIGENSGYFRELILKDVEEALGLKIDYALNEKVHGSEATLSLPDSAIKVVVIPTDEEVMIARDCMKRIENAL